MRQGEPLRQVLPQRPKSHPQHIHAPKPAPKPANALLRTSSSDQRRRIITVGPDGSWNGPARGHLFHVNGGGTLPYAIISIADSFVSIMVDTGSTTNVIDEATYAFLKPRPSCSPADTRIYAYGSKSELQTIGQFESFVE